MRLQGEKTTVDTPYYISRRIVDAEQAGELIRGHRSIENLPHWFWTYVLGRMTAVRGQTMGR
ncbi:MAG: hypothetical protein LBG57_11445 [Treponema sp.]|jgi:hypothetical protein|nr:hypothetical protein [Treponema sp.]